MGTCAEAEKVFSREERVDPGRMTKLWEVVALRSGLRFTPAGRAGVVELSGTREQFGNFWRQWDRLANTPLAKYQFADTLVSEEKKV